MLVIIPARLGSSRLPEKALAGIGQEPLVVHCWRRAKEAGVGPVYVATDDLAIANAVVNVGGEAVMTGECACGTDRVAQAVALIDPDREHEHVINQQGDMPFIEPDIVRDVARALLGTDADIVTPFHRSGFVEASGNDFRRRQASRHIGVYGFRRSALERFTGIKPSPREQSEKLEQLRAVEHGFVVKTIEAETFPMEINTPADLAEARHVAECLA